jgi:hypothetical protein
LDVKEPWVEYVKYKCTVCSSTFDKDGFCMSCGNKLTKDEGRIYDKITIINQFRIESEDASYLLQENGNSNSSGSGYKIEEDLVKFSKKYPKSIFKLKATWDSGFGDPPTIYYVKNGKKQVCEAKLTYE